MRIEYTQLSLNNLEDLYKLTSDPDVSKYMRFDTHKSISETKKLIQEYNRGDAFSIMVDGDFAGVFAFKIIDNEDNLIEEKNDHTYAISIFIASKYWNKGISSTVINYMIDYAKNKQYIHNLSAYVVQENAGSRKILLRNGFEEVRYYEFEGFDSKLFLYSLNV